MWLKLPDTKSVFCAVKEEFILKIHIDIESEPRLYAWLHRSIYNDVDISLDSNLEEFIKFLRFYSFLFCIYVCFSVCVAVFHMPGANRGQQRLLYALDLKQTVASHGVGTGQWIWVI